jgi:hypothetical protein
LKRGFIIEGGNSNVKKCFAAAIMIVAVLATPVFAAVNPFMDVPLNHWAYDAISQLAAQGILSGFPDGTYKGRQPTTRYEMASALARALAVVDMTKAGKQDVDMLKRLIVEFKDELDALGVKVDQIDTRLGVIEKRLGGWQISGTLRMDLDAWDSDDRSGTTNRSMARLFFERWFGGDEEIYFHARLDGGNPVFFDRFYVEFPVWFGTTMTVGLFSWDWEAPYNFYTGGAGDLGNWSLLTDRAFEGYGLTNSFGLGEIQMYVSRANTIQGDLGFDAWEAAAIANLQFTEQFGVDLGVQAFLGDDASVVDDEKLGSLVTFFGGLRFDFSNNVGFRGIYYHQQVKGETLNADTAEWEDWEDDSPHAYRVLVDVKQELIGFSSLWLGYDFLEGGFWTFNGDGFFEIPGRWSAVWYDMSTFRVGAIQRWNDSWSTWLYFAHHTFADAADDGGDLKGSQLALGVEYRYNPSVTFALNYVNLRFDEGANSPGDDHLIRFRSQVDF